MRRETALLIGFLVITIGTAAGLWSMAMPNFHPLTFPQLQSGTMSVGPMRKDRVLTTAQVRMLNDWLAAHKSGWGPLGQTPPSSGDAVMEMQVAHVDNASGAPADSGPFRITLWTGISAADWNNTVFIEEKPGAVIRIHHFNDKDFAPLRELANQFDYPRSAFP
ncbi:hypothetical protein CFR73_00630 [Novacetimonas maltaceti]|uniref:Uncharacterized protein n=1 Tax=Novacetimonas maltaceti TaxID=1203393 RepID=A0A2S3W5K1_9PROT|nr:hypothetical protein [Novacetimonas maltaceti]POF64088.1 hypothetical protein KMAL_03540 [Novacetimonas maltaceti]PYD62121.1 hypothetical protein CFR73_00630 [Novacetimonas maltaceti]